MKKRILASIIGLFIISIIVVASESNAYNENSNPRIEVFLSGSGEENATVRGRHISSGIDYYATNLGKGEYVLQYIPYGTYNIYACGDFNHGSELNVDFTSQGAVSQITLAGAGCPWGGD